MNKTFIMPRTSNAQTVHAYFDSIENSTVTPFKLCS